MCSFPAHSLRTLAPRMKVQPVLPNMELPQAPAAVRSSVSAAFTEERELQRFHFHVDLEQLYKRASILVKLIVFIVGFGGVFKRQIVSDCQHM